MNIYRDGKCAQCNKILVKGDRAFWDGNARTLCCTEIACAEKAGLTTQVWHGSPISGHLITVLADSPIRATRPRRTSSFGCNHEDYPCCGCGQ